MSKFFGIIGTTKYEMECDHEECTTGNPDVWETMQELRDETCCENAGTDACDCEPVIIKCNKVMSEPTANAVIWTLEDVATYITGAYDFDYDTVERMVSFATPGQQVFWSSSDVDVSYIIALEDEKFVVVTIFKNNVEELS